MALPESGLPVGPAAVTSSTTGFDDGFSLTGPRSRSTTAFFDVTAAWKHEVPRMSAARSPFEQPHLLGELALTSPAIMAPMQGVGAPTVRDLVAQLGRPGMVCAPFVRVTAQRPSVSWIRAQLQRTGDIPSSAQLLGSHPEHLALAAKVLADAGADVVDLNLGCPTRLADKKGVGAALLSHFDSIARILERMRAACRCKLSVKIRTTEGDVAAVFRVARIIEASGADILIVHPRTRSQGYQGRADWTTVTRLKSQLRIPVVGNGDLWYASDALRLLGQSGADAVMLGRPALRNPFIFRQIAELCAGKTPYVPVGMDVVRHIRRVAEWAQVDLARRYRGPNGAVKEHIQFILRAVPEPLRSAISQRAMRAVRLDEILTAIDPLCDVAQLDLAADWAAAIRGDACGSQCSGTSLLRSRASAAQAANRAICPPAST